MMFTLTSSVLALAAVASARLSAPSRMDHHEQGQLVKKAQIEARTMDWVRLPSLSSIRSSRRALS